MNFSALNCFPLQVFVVYLHPVISLCTKGSGFSCVKNNKIIITNSTHAN